MFLCELCLLRDKDRNKCEGARRREEGKGEEVKGGGEEDDNDNKNNVKGGTWLCKVTMEKEAPITHPC